MVLDAESNRLAARLRTEGDLAEVVHRQVLAAIRAGDGELAARLGREALYDYYADYVEPGQRGLLDAAVE